MAADRGHPLGVLPTVTDTRDLVASANREDVWRAAAARAGVAAANMLGGTSRGPETFFDGRGLDPAAYLASLTIERSPEPKAMNVTAKPANRCRQHADAPDWSTRDPAVLLPGCTVAMTARDQALALAA